MTPMLEAQNISGLQKERPLLLLEENLEQLSIGNEEEYGWEDELEELSRRLQEPVNLNAATKRQLEQFPFLTDIQIENLLAYVYIHGQMQTIYELQLVEEMDKRTIDLLLPFVCVRAVKAGRGYPALKSILKYGKHETLARLDVPFYIRKGYEKNYLGPSLYHSLRYNFHYGDYLQIGVTGEKDAGEPFFALHNRKGYDYYSFYFLIKNLGRLKALALGNYRLSFGQGLVLSTDFRLGKTFSMSTTEYRTGGIRKHSSTDEYNYFRGVAATVGVLPYLDISAFYSHRSMDGVVEDGEITSIYKTGLHRTQKEADKMNAFALQVIGGNMTYEKNSLKVGVTEKYELPLIIHCVKAMDELLALRKERAPKQPWIWHGFRGKPEQTKQLLQKGFYLSFGMHYSSEAMNVVPDSRLFLETDDSPVNIEDVLRDTAKVRGVEVETLQAIVRKNIQDIFFRA